MTTRDHLLVLNAGSSSLKFELFAHNTEWRSRMRGAVRDIGRAQPVFEVEGRSVADAGGISGHREAAVKILDWLAGDRHGVSISQQSLSATGHRVVHGGDRYEAPVVVDAEVMKHLGALSHLAPLHNPPALSVLEVVRSRLPDVPAVAVFDTAFFRELPTHVQNYAVPRSWSSSHGVRRYGFHGVAHEYLHRRLSETTPSLQAPQRAVSLHLGQGCSVAALRNGRPVETSMGFTPLEGLVMGTRPGDLDAGAILHMARQGRSWAELEDDLNRQSGLLGLSGVSDDVRELLALDDRGHADARNALAVFCHRIHKYLGAYAAVLGGIDALVFGGGIGENSPRIRARICAALEWLGLELDEDANAQCVGCEGRISRASSAIEVRVIRVHEEEAIARAALVCVDGQNARAGASVAPSD